MRSSSFVDSPVAALSVMKAGSTAVLGVRNSMIRGYFVHPKNSSGFFLIPTNPIKSFVISHSRRGRDLSLIVLLPLLPNGLY